MSKDNLSTQKCIDFLPFMKFSIMHDRAWWDYVIPAIVDMTKRFATDVDVNQLLASKFAKSTDNFDSFTQRLLDSYIEQKQLTLDAGDKRTVEEILTGFFASVRKEDGKHYSMNTYNSIRHSLARNMKKAHNLDILKDPMFLRSNSVFEATVQEIKRNGNGVVTHFPVITNEDLLLIANWKWQNPLHMQLKAWFTLHFHSILRGRENLHDLKIDDLLITHENGKDVARLRDKLTKNHRSDVTPSNGGAIYATGDGDCPVKHCSSLSVNCASQIHTCGRDLS